MKMKTSARCKVDKASRRLLDLGYLTSNLGMRCFATADQAIDLAHQRGYMLTNSFTDDDGIIEIVA